MKSFGFYFLLSFLFSKTLIIVVVLAKRFLIFLKRCNVYMVQRWQLATHNKDLLKPYDITKKSFLMLFRSVNVVLHVFQDLIQRWRLSTRSQKCLNLKAVY